MESGARSDATGGKGDWLYPALALAEHIDEVTLPTRPSYAKWTLQTGRPLNLICTSGQLPVKPRPDGGVDSLLRTSTPVCLFTDRFPSRISHFSPPVLTTQPSRWQPSLVISGFPCNFFFGGGKYNFFLLFYSYQNFTAIEFRWKLPLYNTMDFIAEVEVWISVYRICWSISSFVSVKFCSPFFYFYLFIFSRYSSLRMFMFFNSFPFMDRYP